MKVRERAEAGSRLVQTAVLLVILRISDCLLSKFKPNGPSAFPWRSAGRSVRGLAKRQAGVSAPDGSAELVEASSSLSQAGLEADVPENAFQKLGFTAALLFVFFRFSFAHEFVAAKFNFNTHVIIILGVLCYLCSILSGQLFRAFRDKSTWLWVAFTFCMCVATTTSYWRGGSLPILSDFLQTVFPVIFVIPAVTSSKSQIIKMISVIGLACIATVLLGTLNDDFKTGRMSIDAAGSDIQDPNDYAAHLILMMPALAYLTLRPGRSVIWKVIGIVSLGMCFLQILSTGSRGGFLSLGLTGLYIALIGSKRVKLAILVGVPALALLITPFVPASSLTRLSTLFTSSSADQESEATDSSQARLALLQASWKATLEHPILGVGPGYFHGLPGRFGEGQR